MRRHHLRPTYPAADSHATSGRGASRRPPCPHCRGSLYRVPRLLIDRIVSFFVPVHRFRCIEMGCDWEGTLRCAPGTEAPRLPALEAARMGPPRT